VTVETALAAYRGHVYAVERREDAIPLIEQNCVSFHIGNVTAVCGEAPGILEKLPVPDAAFIGGSGGEIGNIISSVLNKNKNARIVIAAITLETVSLSMSALKKMKKGFEIVQISSARAKKAGELHLMEANNPVTVICTTDEQ
jgi:precorrin-6Y C5,15-methyltransferase (decarboxylating)